MDTSKFFVYFNIEPLPAALAAYRGVMCSASSVGTKEFRPIAYWPYGLMRKAAAGDGRARLRFEKEIAVEDVRRRAYPHQVSRLHGIYVWGSEEDAIRCESKWRTSEGQHFDRDNLVELGFTYTNLTKVDTQWIDHFLIEDGIQLDWDDLGWVHQYWSGQPWGENPHWEILVEGRGVLWGTALRTRAMQRVESHWPHLMGQLELSRLAGELGSDLYCITPYLFWKHPQTINVELCIDVRDQNDAFMARVGEYIKSIDKTGVNWRTIKLLEQDQTLPDLRQDGFEFDLGMLSDQVRSRIPALVSERDTISWEGPAPLLKIGA